MWICEHNKLKCYSVTGQGIFCGTDSRNLAYIAGAYSRAFKLIVDSVYGSGDVSVPGTAATHYRSGVLAKLPPPIWLGADRISEIAMELVHGGMELFNTDETSRYFTCPFLGMKSISQQVDWETRETSIRISRMVTKHAVVDAKVFDELGFNASDQKMVDILTGPHPLAYPGVEASESVQAVADLWRLSESDLIQVATLKHGARRQLTKKSYFANRRYELVAHTLEIDVRSVAEIVANELLREPGMVEDTASRNLSWMLGSTLGRWDIRFATGEKPVPELPDPFAPLPACPPGQLQNEQGLPITREEVRRLNEEGRWTYPIEIPWDGILVDDPGHPLDIEARIRQMLQVIWKDRGEAIEHEACEILGMRTLRDYFRKPIGFFADHLKRYSKSRRKAPIYWQLATPSGNYSVWLYYHRFTKDTFYIVLKDHVITKVEHEQRKFDRLRAEAGPDPTRSQRGEIDQQEAFVAELKTFAEEIERIAPLWNPNLNDGVIINFASLWRLVPQHRPWQKECKACWDKLIKGDYDWAHLAMHLWPERVVPKCRTDASLAIAHGLEDVFWKQDEKGKWVANDEPDEGWESTINKLVAERTSPAVKAALESLRSATTPSNGKKTRKTGKRRTRAR